MAQGQPKLAPSEADSCLYCFLMESDAPGLNERHGCTFYLTKIGKTSPSIETTLSISMFRCRLWTRCLFTFTKLPTSQSRYGVSSLDKASTTSRSELIQKQVKLCTASSLAVTVSSSAADRPGLQSAPAARIRTDLRCRTSPVSHDVLPSSLPLPRSSLRPITHIGSREGEFQNRKSRRGIPAPRRLLVNNFSFSL